MNHHLQSRPSFPKIRSLLLSSNLSLLLDLPRQPIVRPFPRPYFKPPLLSCRGHPPVHTVTNHHHHCGHILELYTCYLFSRIYAVVSQLRTPPPFSSLLLLSQMYRSDSNRVLGDWKTTAYGFGEEIQQNLGNPSKTRYGLCNPVRK